MEWHVGVVLCCMPANYQWSQRLFVYTATKGTVIAFPEEGAFSPVLGDWICFRVIPWILPECELVPDYCQHKIDMKCCFPSEAPFSTFIFESLSGNKRVAILVDVSTTRNGNTYSTFCGQIDNYPLHNGEVSVFGVLNLNGMFTWLTVSPRRKLLPKATKNATDLSEDFKKLLTLKKECDKVDPYDENFQPIAQNSTNIPSFDTIKSPKTLSDLVIGLVVNERRTHNGPILFVQVKEVEQVIVMEVPSGQSSYPHSADWIEFKLERFIQPVTVSGVSHQYRMDLLNWRIVDAPVSTYLCDGKDKDIAIEIPLKLIDGKYFSEYVGFISGKPHSLNAKFALVRQFPFKTRKGKNEMKWMFSSLQHNKWKLVSRGGGHLQTVDSQAISSLTMEIVESLMRNDAIADVIQMENFQSWTNMCEIAGHLGFQG